MLSRARPLSHSAEHYQRLHTRILVFRLRFRFHLRFVRPLRSSFPIPIFIISISMQRLSVAARWAELDSCLVELATAADRMRQLCDAKSNNNLKDSNSNSLTSMRDFLVPPSAPLEAHSNRNTMVATLAKLQMLVAEPTELLSHLAMQVYSHLAIVKP
jgi:hypothetical protein